MFLYVSFKERRLFTVEEIRTRSSRTLWSRVLEEGFACGKFGNNFVETDLRKIGLYDNVFVFSCGDGRRYSDIFSRGKRRREKKVLFFYNYVSCHVACYYNIDSYKTKRKMKKEKYSWRTYNIISYIFVFGYIFV